jgi:hypothetical protein
MPFEYHPRNETALQGEKEALEKQASEWGNNAPMLYFRAGTTMIRILPPWNEKGVFFREITRHRIRVGKRTEILACPAAEANLPCSLCQKGQELTDSRDDVKMKFARDHLRPRTQYLYNVLCYSGPANPKNGEVPEFGKVYVAEGGVMVHRQIISLDTDPQAGWNDITNPEAGVLLLIKRTGQGLDTKYEVNPHGAGRTNFFADLQSRGIDANTLELINLDEVYAIPPQEKIDELAAQLNVGGAFPGASVPAPQPALPTVSPPAAAAPVAPVAAPVVPAAPVPAPVAAPPIAPPPGQPAQTVTGVQPPLVAAPPAGPPNQTVTGPEQTAAQAQAPVPVPPPVIPDPPKAE